MLRINDHLAIPLSEFRLDFARSGGPGGQNVNKVNSKVLLRWNPAASPSLPGPIRERLLMILAGRLTVAGDLLVTSQSSRDQSRNIAECFAKLRVILTKAVYPPKARKATKPTHGSQLRRVEEKSRRSRTKEGRRKPDLD